MHVSAHSPDWSAIDTVLLDMDGTLLDLAYDKRFWEEHLPRRFAESRGIAVEEVEPEAFEDEPDTGRLRGNEFSDDADTDGGFVR